MTDTKSAPVITDKYEIHNEDRLDKYGVLHKAWDSAIPTDSFFVELQRISVNQIVWGGNYFPFLWSDGCKGFIFWHKHQPVTNWAAGELAWTSFNRPAMCFDYMCYGGVNQDVNRTHPTQKPINLYKWLLGNYTKPGDKILDTHGGSMSSVIAALDMGFHITCSELDTEYFEAAKKRIEIYLSQLKLF